MTDSAFVRDPAAFNAMAYSLTNDRRHASGPDLFRVTAASHPILFEVFEAISHDGGGSAGHDSYSVPAGLEERAARAEAFLSRLTSDERDTVAIGDQDEAAGILAERRESEAEGADVDAFLNAFFEDWHEEGAE